VPSSPNDPRQSGELCVDPPKKLERQNDALRRPKTTTLDSAGFIEVELAQSCDTG